LSSSSEESTRCHIPEDGNLLPVILLPILRLLHPHFFQVPSLLVFFLLLVLNVSSYYSSSSHNSYSCLEFNARPSNLI
jgi:hypothetical protein